MTTLFSDLPNLNFGLTVKQLNCVIHPTIAPNILDHYLRKPEDQEIVVGILLGTLDGSQIDIYSSFAVPQYIEKDQKELIIDYEYMQKMLKFYRKVNPKEGLLGMYISAKKLDYHGLQLLTYFQELF
jgi:translation initiation factor 3 subunit F